MPEKLARSVVVTPCCRHHSLTERPLLRHSWICAAHSCSSARCFNSALVILTSHNTTVAKPFATFRYYCLMCVYARLGLTVTIQSCPLRSKQHRKQLSKKRAWQSHTLFFITQGFSDCPALSPVAAFYIQNDSCLNSVVIENGLIRFRRLRWDKLTPYFKHFI